MAGFTEIEGPHLRMLANLGRRAFHEDLPRHQDGNAAGKRKTMSMSCSMRSTAIEAGSCAIASKMTATSAAGTPAAGSSSSRMRGSSASAIASSTMRCTPVGSIRLRGAARVQASASRISDTRASARSRTRRLGHRRPAVSQCSATASATFSSTVSRRNRLVI